MKRYLLLGLAALGLVAMASTESKADEDSAFTLGRDTNKTGLIIIARTPGAIGTIVTRTNIVGTNGSGGAVQ